MHNRLPEALRNGYRNVTECFVVFQTSIRTMCISTCFFVSQGIPHRVLPLHSRIRTETRSRGRPYRRHVDCGRSRRTGLKMAYIIRSYRWEKRIWPCDLTGKESTDGDSGKEKNGTRVVQGKNLQSPRLQVSVGSCFRALRAPSMYTTKTYV